jgi:hypothetical protein
LSLYACNGNLLSRAFGCCSSAPLRLLSHILPFLNIKNSYRNAWVAAPIQMSTCLEVPRTSILKLLFCCLTQIDCLLPLKISSSAFLNHLSPRSTMAISLPRPVSMLIARASIVRYFPFFSCENRPFRFSAPKHHGHCPLVRDSSIFLLFSIQKIYWHIIASKAQIAISVDSRIQPI